MLYDKLIENGIIFSFEVHHGASFIMPDGKFLSLEENTEAGIIPKYNRPFAIHPNLVIFIQRRGLCNKEDGPIGYDLMYSDNAIRVNTGSNFAFERAYIRLPNQKPTPGQFESLQAWLEFLVGKSEVIDVSYKQDSIYSEKHLNSVDDIEGIMKAIRKIYGSYGEN